MSYVDYLKEQLAEIAATEADPKRIREQYANGSDFSASTRPCYPSMCGALESTVGQNARTAASMLRWITEHIEPAIREHERLVSIFEALDIDLGEEELATLELIGKRKYSDRYAETSAYKDERRQISSVINKAIEDVQEAERERERDDATEAIQSAGFVFDEYDETLIRGAEQVRIELVNGRESRYKWEYETSDPVHRIESGKSGEFSRLLALIAGKPAEVQP